jgi:photosystem II stability/assembly factor-like uncharacterized protein
VGAWRVYEGTVPRYAFYSVHGSDPSHVWFVGESSQVLFWDGTQMYSQTQGVPAGKDFRKVWAQSSSRAFAVGDASAFMETKNGGESWRPITVDYDDDYHAVSVVRAAEGLVGWALGNTNGNRLYYNGTSWAPASPADRNNRTHHYSDVSMVGPGAAFAVQDNDTGGRIYAWNGTEWGPGPSSGQMFDLDVLSASEGVAVGVRGTTWRLNEAGNWENMTNKPGTAGNSLYGVDMVSGDRIWAVGQRGGIYMWDGSAWTNKSVSGQVKDLYSVWMAADGSQGWAVGDNGVFLRYE